MMSDDTPTGRHPSSLTNAESEALRASDPAAFEDDDRSNSEPADATTTDAPSATDAAKAEGEGAEGDAGKVDDDGTKQEAETAKDASAEGDSEPEPEADPDGGNAPPDMIPRGRLNQVRAREKTKDQIIEQQMQELRQLRELQAASKAPKDFGAERKAIMTKYDDGDLDEEERDEALESLADERMAHIASGAALRAMEQTREATIKRGWDAAVAEWSSEHAEFLSDKSNADVLQRSINSVIAMYGDNIGNDELLAKAAKQAFEHVGYVRPGGEPAAAPEAAANRRAQNARAASDASATPPAISGGVGERGGPNRGVDVANIKPGNFSKNLTPEQQEQLLGAGAL